eukprot:295979_1
MAEVSRDPLHHKGALISYSIATVVVAFLLATHIIASYKSTKRLTHRIKNKPIATQKKQMLHHYLMVISCGLSIACYFSICVGGILAEAHYPSCSCATLGWLIPNMYTTGKVLTYYYFLLKASSAQGMINVFPSYFPSKDKMFNIYFPILLIITLSIYIFLFNVGPSVFENWSVVCVYTETSHIGCQYMPTADFRLLASLAPITDVSLSLLFTFLFYVPIVKVTKMSWNEFVNNAKYGDTEQSKEHFISILKISLILSLINIFSSTILFSTIPWYPSFWYVFSFDYVINASSSFGMLGDDRRLLIKCLKCSCCKVGEIENNDRSVRSMNNVEKSIQTMAVMEQIEMENNNDILIKEQPLNLTTYSTEIHDNANL